MSAMPIAIFASVVWITLFVYMIRCENEGREYRRSLSILRDASRCKRTCKDIAIALEISDDAGNPAEYVQFALCERVRNKETGE